MVMTDVKAFNCCFPLQTHQSYQILKDYFEFPCCCWMRATMIGKRLIRVSMKRHYAFEGGRNGNYEVAVQKWGRHSQYSMEFRPACLAVTWSSCDHFLTRVQTLTRRAGYTSTTCRRPHVTAMPRPWYDCCWTKVCQRTQLWETYTLRPQRAI